jgi:diaminopropionate ammonia-lyase
MLAWPYLRDGLDAAVAVADADSATAARDLESRGIPAHERLKQPSSVGGIA